MTNAIVNKSFVDRQTPINADWLNGVNDAVQALPIDTSTSYIGYKRTNGTVRTIKSKLDDIISVKDFGAVGDGTTDDTTAIQNTINNAKIVYFPPGTYKCTVPLVLTSTQTRLVGAGYSTQIYSTSSTSAIDFDGYAGCAVENLVVYSTTGTIGIKIAPNGGATRFPHWWRLSRVMVIGNTPNWSSTSLAASRSGFSTAGVYIKTAFYGTAEHSETSYCVGTGWNLLDQANGNTFTSCHSRDCAIGVKIEGTGGGNSNGNSWVGGNIEASIASSVGISLGEADRNKFIGRMEISAAGGTHVIVNPPVGTLAQENTFELELTGTSAGYTLGDGVGSSQVLGTRIDSGKFGSSITINSDCLYTKVTGAQSGISGVSITDNGYGTIFYGTLDSTKWYERPYNQNTAAYNHNLLVGTGSVVESLGDNAKVMDFTSYSNAFQWKKINAGGTNLAVMLFGAYRVWVSPTDGKMYLKGSDPTTHNDGTVVGTQT